MTEPRTPADWILPSRVQLHTNATYLIVIAETGQPAIDVVRVVSRPGSPLIRCAPIEGYLSRFFVVTLSGLVLHIRRAMITALPGPTQADRHLHLSVLAWGFVNRGDASGDMYAVTTESLTGPPPGVFSFVYEETGGNDIQYHLVSILPSNTRTRYWQIAEQRRRQLVPSPRTLPTKPSVRVSAVALIDLSEE